MIGLFSNKDFQNAHPEFNFHRTYILTSSSKIGELSGEIDSNFDISGIIYIGKNEDKLNFEKPILSLSSTSNFARKNVVSINFDLENFDKIELYSELRKLYRRFSLNNYLKAASDTISNFIRSSDMIYWDRGEENHLGNIPILMYHNIYEKDDRYIVRPEKLYMDLLDFYKRGFLPISMEDYINKKINIPKGFSPYIITFDDGEKNNFDLKKDGSIDKKCGVGVILQFAKDFDLFKPRASFYVIRDVPFYDKNSAEEKIDILYENGMEVGNHTFNHLHFGEMDNAEDVQKAIASEDKVIKSFSKEEYFTDVLALPYGDPPKKEFLHLLEEGSYDGHSYKNRAIVYVKQKLALSPFDPEFDPMEIQRLGIGSPYNTTAESILEMVWDNKFIK